MMKDLAKLREINNLTQEEAAELAEIPLETYKEIEAGSEGDLKAVYLLGLGYAFNVRLGALIAETKMKTNVVTFDCHTDSFDDMKRKLIQVMELDSYLDENFC